MFYVISVIIFLIHICMQLYNTKCLLLFREHLIIIYVINFLHRIAKISQISLTKFKDKFQVLRNPYFIGQLFDKAYLILSEYRIINCQLYRNYSTNKHRYRESFWANEIIFILHFDNHVDKSYISFFTISYSINDNVYMKTKIVRAH